MLKQYCATTVANTQATLFTVANSKQLAVLSVELYGGTNGGQVTFVRNNGSSDVFTQVVPVSANTYVSIDCKSFFESGWSLKQTGSAAGIQIAVNGDLVDA